MQKGIEPTEEEVKGKKLALTPLTALPEELILFQRVLQLFRGVRTSVFDACQSTRGSWNVWLVVGAAVHIALRVSQLHRAHLSVRGAQLSAPGPDHLSVGALSRACWSFAGARTAQRWRVPCRARAAAGAGARGRRGRRGAAAGARHALGHPVRRRRRGAQPFAHIHIHGLWPHCAALVQMEYVDTRSGQVVFEMPPEVAAAEKAMMEGGGS